MDDPAHTDNATRDSGTDLDDRVLGALLGGAIGDALGAGVENAGRVPPDVELVPRAVTDDTQLTFATLRAVARAGADPQAIAAEMLVDFRAGRLTGLGSSTLGALKGLDVGGHWALVGARGERAQGNGAAMRILPVALIIDPCHAEGRRAVRDVARITHHSEEACAGALAIAIAVRLELAGVLTVEAVAQRLPDSRVRDALERAVSCVGAPLEETVQVLGNSGWVVESVPLAITVAAQPTAGITRALPAVVRLGGDADTIGSLVGQLLGLRHGAATIEAAIADRALPAPADWRAWKAEAERAFPELRRRLRQDGRRP